MTVDEQIRAAYDAAVAEWAGARAAVQADGIVITDPKGRLVPHPALAVERSAAAEMRAWMAEIRRIETAPAAEDRPRRGW